MFIATFIIHKFGVDDIVPWIMTLSNENKVTFLTTSMRKANTSDIIFKVPTALIQKYLYNQFCYFFIHYRILNRNDTHVIITQGQKLIQIQVRSISIAKRLWEYKY